MSDATEVVDDVEVVEDVQPVTPAEAKTTEQNPGEHMIPKSRFDELNKRLKEMEATAKAAEKKVSDAEKQKLLDQQEYKTLFEASEKARIEAEKAVNIANQATIKANVARKFKQLPEAFIELLQGDTTEELELHAQTLLDAMPTAQIATDTDASAGVNGKAPTQPKSDQEIKEMAARLGVSFEHLKKQYVKEQ